MAVRREKPTGRYAADFNRVCQCGHRLGEHIAEGKISQAHCTICDCEGFKRAPEINSRRRDVQKAIKLFEEFRETPARRGRTVEIETPKVVMIMGTVRFIGYDTTIKGKTDLRAHNFAPGSRPYLCVNPANQQLFIVEGRYHVTDRGIVDLDARHHEIDDGAEGEWKPIDH